MAEHFSERADKIFGKADWEHRTLRTIFDPPSNEWKKTDLDQKVEILRRIIASGESLALIVAEYKKWYGNEKGAAQLEGTVEDALVQLVSHQLSKG